MGGGEEVFVDEELAKRLSATLESTVRHGSYCCEIVKVIG